MGRTSEPKELIEMEPEPADPTAALDQIDTSSLDALDVVRADEVAVRELIHKATERKDKVSQSVFAKVMTDYDTRLKGLEEQARPLRDQARGELAKLTTLHARLKATLETASLTQQEIEFRHELGELQDGDYQAKEQKAREEVSTCQQAFDRAESLRQRFVTLLPPEPKPEPPPPTRTGKAKAASDPGSVSRAAKAATIVPEADAEPKTVFVPKDSKPAPAADEDDDGEYGTVTVDKPARLVEDKDGTPGTIHLIGTTAAIGRTPDNQVPIETPDISRHHAKIELRPDGTYTVTDLNSGNGTFVNGERIKEQRLGDGDKVRFGNHSFIFHV